MSEQFSLFSPEATAALGVGASYASPVPGKRQGGGLSKGGEGKVPIVEIDVEMELEDEVNGRCCGAIGDGKKMCGLRRCVVMSHQRNKVNLGEVGSGPHIFICVKDDDSQVFVRPIVHKENLDNAGVDFYLAETRLIRDWQTLFKVWEEGSTEDIKKLMIHMEDDRGEDTSKTPFKKRKVFNDATMSPSGQDDDMEDAWMELETNIGLSPQSQSRQQSNLVANVSLLKRSLSLTRESLKALNSAVVYEFERTDMSHATLENLLGRRSETLGTSSVFELLEELRIKSEEFESVSAFLNSPMFLTNVIQNTEDKLKQEKTFMTFKNVKEATMPLMQLFLSQSSGPSRPGDLLEKDLNTIRSRIQILEQGSSPTVAQASMTGYNLFATQGTGSSNTTTSHSVSSQGGVPVNAQVVALEKKVQHLQTVVKNLQNQVEATTVKINDVTFASRSVTSDWLKANVLDASGYMYFLDAHGLMSLMGDNDGDGHQDKLSFANAAKKGGYQNTEEALIVASFHFELPVFFGKSTSNNAASSDSRVLPCANAYGVWKDPTGYAGVSKKLMRRLAEIRDRLSVSIEASLSGNARTLAIQMMSASISFFHSLNGWMTSEYDELTGRGCKEKQAWLLISQSVRAIFLELHKSRKAGRGPFISLEARQSGIMWGSLQAYRRMEELVQNGFKGDQAVSLILNVFLRDNACLKEDMEDVKQDLMKKVAEVMAMATAANTEAKSARKVADQAKVSNRRPGAS